MSAINKKTTINFNKEILFGELGALACAPLTSYIASHFTSNVKFISLSAVIGAIAGGTIFWLSMRIHDKGIEKRLSVRGIADDIRYFTPAAFLLTLLVYYPTLFFVSLDLLSKQNKVLSSIIFSQITAFFFFLLMINAYRYILAKLYGKVL